MRLPFFYRETQGIRITVHPLFLGDQSDPDSHRFVFAYFVRIENTGTEAVHLRSRKWLIHDSIGEDSGVEGDGVVGQQPVLQPGGVHEYQSFCILKSPSGHMEGEYRFERADGSAFQAQIPRFILDAAAGAESN